MQDQVISLWEKNIPATFVNSTLTSDEKVKRIEMFSKGLFKFLYAAPERFRWDKSLIEKLRNLNINIFVIDEAHCIDLWGHSFRPDYFHLREIVKKIGRPSIVALTATASPLVKKEIISRLGMKDPKIFISDINRENSTDPLKK